MRVDLWIEAHVCVVACVRMCAYVHTCVRATHIGARVCMRACARTRLRGRLRRGHCEYGIECIDMYEPIDTPGHGHAFERVL